MTRLWPDVCPSVSVSEWDPEEEVDESLLVVLLSLLDERRGKQLSSTASSSDEDDDAVELSSGSELKSSSCETHMLVYNYVNCSKANMWTSAKTPVSCITLHLVHTRTITTDHKNLHIWRSNTEYKTLNAFIYLLSYKTLYFFLVWDFWQETIRTTSVWYMALIKIIKNMVTHCFGVVVGLVMASICRDTTLVLQWGGCMGQKTGDPGDQCQHWFLLVMLHNLCHLQK